MARSATILQERGGAVSNPPPVRRSLALLCALTALLVTTGPAAAGTSVSGGEVWFMRDGKPVAVAA